MVGGEASNVSGPYQRLYRCPNVHTEQRGVYTNTGPAVAFHAPGFVEGAFALESAMDELARALHIDPLDLRLQNYADHDQLRRRPYTTPESLRRCYQRASETFGWRTYQRPPADGPKRRGIRISRASEHLPGLPSWQNSEADLLHRSSSTDRDAYGNMTVDARITAPMICSCASLMGRWKLP